MKTQSDLVQWKLNSPAGPLYLVASPKGLQGVFWEKQNAPVRKNAVIERCVQQLEEYFAGTRKVFDLPIDTHHLGTPFQKRVWNELKKIPYGKTLSYKQIAQKLKTKAVRAVGSANGKNPLSIIVPCHRVIASDGSLGGYAGGLKTKTLLLKIEHSLNIQ